MLKIEDVKVGDSVECIDIAEFSKIWREAQGYDINKMEGMSILEIGPCYFSLKGKFLIGNIGFDEIRPSLDCLKYFKKKEQSQYTLDDLVNVAFQAKKDGVVCEVIWNDFLSVSGISLENQIVVASDQVSSDFICDAIKAIKALYKEVFVIETVEDIKNIEASKRVDSIKLTNNIILSCDDLYAISHYTNDFLFKLLKGATVEQDRGCNE